MCTHATFRFAVERFGVEAFDDRVIAVDEFHHVSANPDNRLGAHLGSFMARDRVHIVAMTGSYFRGDAEAVMMPTDEAKFETVTYTYYEQLNGYEWLKSLDIGYFFYNGPYVDDILKVLDPNEKTILHIPNVNSRESTKDKHKEVEEIIEYLGEWQGVDPVTGFQLVKTAEGRLLRIADLVDDEGPRRDRVSGALKDPAQKMNRDHVDMIIALGMAKEGFDWIWCEHALTVGYRASLTEVVQIIGRATRDAPGKTHARFTNLIAEPDASQGLVTEAVNDTLKAIAASLLMEQVLAPRFEFKPKTQACVAQPGFDYGDDGYDPTKCNVGFNEASGTFQIEIKGLVEPRSKEARVILSAGFLRVHGPAPMHSWPTMTCCLRSGSLWPCRAAIDFSGGAVLDGTRCARRSMEMFMHTHENPALEDRIIGLLSLGRLLSDMAGSVPTEIDLRGARFDRFFSEIAEGNILQPGHGAVLQDLGHAVLAYFEEECPGHIETMFCGTLQDFPLRNAEWATVRAFWDALLQFRVEAQHVQDYVRATKIAVELRRRSNR